MILLLFSFWLASLARTPSVRYLMKSLSLLTEDDSSHQEPFAQHFSYRQLSSRLILGFSQLQALHGQGLHRKGKRVPASDNARSILDQVHTS